MTTWAVTGASGYVGSALVRHLLRSGHAVRCLSRRTSNFPGATVITGDLFDAQALRRLADGADVVVHLAAYVHRRARSAREMVECRTVNVDGTQHIIDACSQAPSRPFLVFISTAAVYAAGEYEADESSGILPSTVYGETKAQAEQLVSNAVRTGRIRGSILRPSVIFGVGAPGNVERLSRMARRGIFFAVGGATALKSLAPVGMVINAILAVAHASEEANGREYNVGGEAASMRRIAEVIAESAGVNLCIVPVPLRPVRVAARSVDLLASATRLPLPSISRMLDAYFSTTRISDARLRALPLFDWPFPLESALRSYARGKDLALDR